MNSGTSLMAGSVPTAALPQSRLPWPRANGTGSVALLKTVLARFSQRLGLLSCGKRQLPETTPSCNTGSGSLFCSCIGFLAALAVAHHHIGILLAHANQQEALAVSR